MLTRFIRWLLGLPPKDQLEAHLALSAERDLGKTGAIVASDHANVTGSRRNHGPQQQ